VLDLHALHGRDDEQTGVRRPDGRLDVTDEVGVPGGVEEVDLHVSPLHGGEGQGDADAPAHLLRLEVGDGVPVLDLSHPGGGPGGEQEGLRQGGLPRTAVTDQEDVADVRGVVGLHGEDSLRWERLGL